MAADLNTVALTGRLTKDVDLRSTGSGTSVASIRLAFTTSRKDSDGDWADKSNFVDVTVWGRQAENCERYLEKGRMIAVKGRLEFEEWEAKEGGKRNALKVVAESVVFLGDGKHDGGKSSGGQQRTGQSDVPDDSAGSVPVSSGGAVPTGDDDSDTIPF